MARQVLNVQKYPDMRQYPGGPPMRPYDAAGWTLPLQMGVASAAAATPLADEVRANLRLLGPAPDPRRKPTSYVTTDARDAAPLRQRARHRLRREPDRGGRRAPGGKGDRPGPALSVDPAQNNAFRAVVENLDGGRRPACVLAAGPAGQRPLCHRPGSRKGRRRDSSTRWP